MIATSREPVKSKTSKLSMPSKLSKLLMLSALALATSSCSSAAVTPVVPPSSAAKFLPPEGKTLLIVGQDIDAENNYVKGTGHIPAGVTVYTSLALDGVFARNHGQPEGVQDWNSVKVGYPNSALAVGLYMAGADKNTQMDQLLNGNATFDKNLDILIDELQSFNRPIFLRIGYEADGPWNNYDPTQYKAAWKKIVERIRAKKANRIATVWQITGFCTDKQGYKNFPTEDWYPGDDLVDWTGFSMFRALNDCPAGIQTVIDTLKTKKKPILMAESAPVTYDIGNSTINPNAGSIKPPLPVVTGQQLWDGWFKPYFELIEKNKDAIRGVAYINQDWKAYATWACSRPNADGVQNCPSTYWGDTRVEANAVVKSNWAAAIQKPFFLSSAASDLFGQLEGFEKGTVAAVSTPQRSDGKPWPVPGKLEAEAYNRGGEGVAYHDNSAGQSQGYTDFGVLWRANESVDIGTDGGTGFSLGWTEAGEWLDYSIDVDKTASLNMDVSVASKGAGGTFELLLDGSKVGNTVTIPDTGDWVSFKSVSAGAATMTAGKHTLRINFLTNGTGNGGTSPGNIDKLVIGGAATRSPFKGVIAIPGVLQAENYDIGGQDLTYNDTTSDNKGDKNFRNDAVDVGPIGSSTTEYTVGWIDPLEWLEYSVNVDSAGTYDVVFAVACPSLGGKIQLSLDGKALGTAVTVVNTGDWNVFKDVALTGITLPAGPHILRMTFTEAGSGGVGNVDKLTFIKK
jgi:hypothetical protein